MFKDTTDDKSESTRNSDTEHTRRSYISRMAATTTALGVGTGVMGTAAAQLEDEAASEQVAAQLQQLEGEWPQFQFDPGNTGFNPDGTGPLESISTRWTFETDATSAAIVDNTVYVGAIRNANVYALDADTGTVQWSFETEDIVTSSPAVDDGTVYIGDRDGNMYALDADDGTEQWRYEIQSVGMGIQTPAVADGTVYFSSSASAIPNSGDGNVYALDADDGTEQWIFNTEVRFVGAPAVTDETVYVIADPGAQIDDTLYALDADDGTEQWTFDGENLAGIPTVADGTVYIGDIPRFESNVVYALDADDGTEQWIFDVGSLSLSISPAVADGTVYIGTFSQIGDSGSMISVDADDGTEQWRFTADFGVFSSPAVVDDTIYFGGSSTIFALDAADGTEQWSFNIGSFSTAPAVANGTVYVGSFDNTLYAIEEGPDDPTASITFQDQESDGTTVVINQVQLSNGGYVEITDGEGTVLGQSETLTAGTYENVEVTLSPVLEESQELTATVYESSGDPYLEDGEPVSDTAFITVADPVQPTASITFDNQKSAGTTVVIQQVELSEGGFVEIIDTDGVARGRTVDFEAGTYENLEVTLIPSLTETQQLNATVYRDIDAPYLEDGEPVSATALITVRPGEKLPDKKCQQKKREYERKKIEYEKAKKKYEKDHLSKKELKKKRGAYEQAKHEYKECK